MHFNCFTINLNEVIIKNIDIIILMDDFKEMHRDNIYIFSSAKVVF